MVAMQVLGGYEVVDYQYDSISEQNAFGIYKEMSPGECQIYASG